MSVFQSYLILGKPGQRRIQTAILARNLGIDLATVSPDIFTLTPQNQSISINQIRDLKAHIFEKPVKSKYKFVIIEDAQKLTPEAQNALLKILEEPPDCAIIVLEAEDRQNLLPTILSRVVIKRTKPSKVQIPSNLTTFEKRDLLKTLEIIAQIENPTDFLDEQIQLLYEQLLINLKGQPLKQPVNYLTEMIEKSIKAKIMIAANVDAKFVLADLIFSLKSFGYPKPN